jgi:hypothetical protein
LHRLALAIALLLAPSAAWAQAEPHAFLFGSWSGGYMPPDRSGNRTACLAQPTVIFMRDIVLHSTALDPLFQQRIIETVRATDDGVEIRFRPAPRPPGPLARLSGTGFGCGDPNLLRVERLENGEIAFPGCIDFPSPLVSCTGR